MGKKGHAFCWENEAQEMTPKLLAPAKVCPVLGNIRDVPWHLSKRGGELEKRWPFSVLDKNGAHKNKACTTAACLPYVFSSAYCFKAPAADGVCLCSRDHFWPTSFFILISWYDCCFKSTPCDLKVLCVTRQRVSKRSRQMASEKLGYILQYVKVQMSFCMAVKLFTTTPYTILLMTLQCGVCIFV